MILRLSRINEVRLQNLYLALYPVWNHIMNINKVKHDKCDWSSDTSLYLQSGINVLSACHFTYSPKTQQNQSFRKSLIISHRVNALAATKFSRNTSLSYIVVSQKFKLKLKNAKFLLSMISPNELSITLSTLWSHAVMMLRRLCYNILPVWWVLCSDDATTGVLQHSPRLVSPMQWWCYYGCVTTFSPFGESNAVMMLLYGCVHRRRQGPVGCPAWTT